MIVAQTLTEKEIGDPSQVGPLLDPIQEDIEQVTADGAYDGAPTYQTVPKHDARDLGIGTPVGNKLGPGLCRVLRAEELRRCPPGFGVRWRQH
jgi:hypothetical protein